jgi:hypothetical protein
VKQTYRIKKGKIYLFEYHCWESLESADAALWLRSHRRVRVIKLINAGYGKDEEERGYNGQSATFEIEFADRARFHAAEDELLLSRKEYCRPDPPVVVKQ